jgi:two-component system, chemotaxis family, CheB/CheR fusion protein
VNGVLFLGASESTGRQTNLYATIDKKYRIYQRRETRPRCPVFRRDRPVSRPFLGNSEPEPVQLDRESSAGASTIRPAKGAHHAGGGEARENLVVQADGHRRLLDLIVEPLSGGPFRGGVRRASGDGDLPQCARPARAVHRWLGAELATTREQLRATIDALESANEEMESSNEEYQSVNEELQ